MNNKGMTTIELIASFSLATIIFMLLFNVVLSIKEIYSSSGVKTTLLIEQANLSRTLNQSINSSNELVSIDMIKRDNVEYIFHFHDGTTKSLVINEKEGAITYDHYTYHLGSNMKLKPTENQLAIDGKGFGSYVYVVGLDDRLLLVIDIPIYVKGFIDNFGIKVVYQDLSKNLSLNTI